MTPFIDGRPISGTTAAPAYRLKQDSSEAGFLVCLRRRGGKRQAGDKNMAASGDHQIVMSRGEH